VRTCPKCKRDVPNEFAFCPYDATPIASPEQSASGPVSVAKPPPLPPPGRPVPTNIGRFRVHRLLGEGAMGRVFHAQDLEKNQHVAIKVLDTAQARSPQGAERFLREVKSLRALNHPNVIRVFEAGLRPDGAPFYVMEFLEGEPLGATFKRTPKVPMPLALKIAHDVASGLNAAHGAGMVHRDVKPDNIFLCGPVGEPERAKLIDFGLARVTGQTHLTAKGIIVGTVEYMAPEQAVGDPVGRRADIYALGVILYRMLTGRLPFIGETGEILAQQLATPPRPPSSFAPEIPRAVEHLVLTAMRKLPRNRPPTMQDFLDDLERVMHDPYAESSIDSLGFEDVYEPQSAFSKNIAEILTKKAREREASRPRLQIVEDPPESS
jgi:serine/threonine-protein kinase